MMQGWVGPGLLQESQGVSTWWVWVLIIVLLLALILWFFSLRKGYGTAQEAADDLTRIEGIGPKISALLQVSGIQTYSELSKTGLERLQSILDGAEFRVIADPTTWPEQARLAAGGEWEQLQALQDSLQGGRRE